MARKKKDFVKEQDYIYLLKPKYNILKTAGYLLRVKHKEKTKKLMSTNNKRKTSFFVIYYFYLTYLSYSSTSYYYIN